MLTLVTGGSGSGKSAFAEQLAVDGERTPGPRYYIATMRPWDEECVARINRHREMRASKGFLTLEAYGFLKESISFGVSGIVLLECLSNLTANVCFDSSLEPETVVACLEAELLEIERSSQELIVVTNEVFSDGVMYGQDIVRYLRILGDLNCRLAKRANRVAEVVYGIPVWQKGGM